MVVGPLEIIGAISALSSLIGNVIILAGNLSGISNQCAALVQQLKTLSGVLNHVDQEFSKTMRAMATDPDNIGLDVTRDLLKECLKDCTTTCEEYEIILSQVSRATLRALKWKRYSAELDRLHLDLEARKSTLLTVLISIRQAGDKCRHGKVNPEPPIQPPPSYDAAVEPTTLRRSLDCDPSTDTDDMKVFLASASTGVVVGAAVGSLGGPLGALLGGCAGILAGEIIAFAVASLGHQKNDAARKYRSKMHTDAHKLEMDKLDIDIKKSLAAIEQTTPIDIKPLPGTKQAVTKQIRTKRTEMSLARE